MLQIKPDIFAGCNLQGARGQEAGLFVAPLLAQSQGSVPSGEVVIRRGWSVNKSLLQEGCLPALPPFRSSPSLFLASAFSLWFFPTSPVFSSPTLLKFTWGPFSFETALLSPVCLLTGSLREAHRWAAGATMEQNTRKRDGGKWTMPPTGDKAEGQLEEHSEDSEGPFPWGGDLCPPPPLMVTQKERKWMAGER